MLSVTNLGSRYRGRGGPLCIAIDALNIFSESRYVFTFHEDDITFNLMVTSIHKLFVFCFQCFVLCSYVFANFQVRYYGEHLFRARRCSINDGELLYRIYIRNWSQLFNTGPCLKPLLSPVQANSLMETLNSRQSLRGTGLREGSLTGNTTSFPLEDCHTPFFCFK